MKLEKGKWYYMIEDGRTVVEEGGGQLSWSDDWQEIEPPVIEVIEKPKTLADVEPEVGMLIRRPYWTEGSTSFKVEALVNGYMVTVDAGDRNNVNAFRLADSDLKLWLVVGEPTQPKNLSVEESLKPENAGRMGRWKKRGGEVVVGRFTWDGHDVYPVDMNGDCYTRDGRLWEGRKSSQDFVAFWGWVKE